MPLVGLGWWISGTDEALADDATPASRRTWCRARRPGPEHGILVVRGDVESGLTYTVRRGDGVTLGEDEIIGLAGEDDEFTATVRTLTSRPTPEVVDDLADRGIEYVVLPAPADGSVAAALDATGGLVQASAEDRATRAWQVSRPLDPDAVDGPRSWLRIGLLVLQALALIAVLVLCLPTLRARRCRMSTPTPGRRSAARSDRAAASTSPCCSRSALAAARPAGALLLVRPDDPPEDDVATRGDRADPGDADLSLRGRRRRGGQRHRRVRRGASSARASGGGRARCPRDGPPSVRTGEAPAVVTAEGDLAPGLLAGRFGEPLVAPECRPPAFDEWFTGVGAGAKHSSVLELVNPDAGPAVVDVTRVRPPRAGRRAARCAAWRCPAGPSSHLDLARARAAPRRPRTARRPRPGAGSSASVARHLRRARLGRLGHRLPALAGRAPATSNLLLGLPDGTGRRTLLLANPAETETRASIKVVTEDAVFAAVGTEDVVIAPQSVARVAVSTLLRGKNAADASGLLVESTAPVTASARFYVDGDLTHAVPPEPVDETALLVPTGRQAAGARRRRPGRRRHGRSPRTPRVRSWPRTGSRSMPGRGGVLELPDEAVLVGSAPTAPPIDGAVLAGGDGAAVFRLRPLQRSGLIADVRPGLP